MYLQIKSKQTGLTGAFLEGGGIQKKEKQITKKRRKNALDNSVVIVWGRNWVEVEEDIAGINYDGKKIK